VVLKNGLNVDKCFGVCIYLFNIFTKKIKIGITLLGFETPIFEKSKTTLLGFKTLEGFITFATLYMKIFALFM